MDALVRLLEGGRLGAARSVAMVVADSLRWDSFARARTPVLDRWAPLQERRYAYASWTLPSHACILSGLVPHRSRPGTIALEAYEISRRFWSALLAGGADVSRAFAEDFAIASLAQKQGWRTVGRVAMSVLHPGTSSSRGFDDYALLKPPWSMAAQVESLTPHLSGERDFVFVNAGEAHYPYLLPELPHLSGLHGALTTPDGAAPADRPPGLPFDAARLAELHQAQVVAMERLDESISNLLDVLPKPTVLLFLSDHGELFGEDGYFGHGPFFHEKLFEVPLAVGLVE